MGLAFSKRNSPSFHLIGVVEDIHGARTTLNVLEKALKDNPARIEERKDILLSENRQKRKWYLPECTPLMAACYYRNWEVVRYLVDIGAELNVGEFTPLMRASKFGASLIVELMLEKGANIDASSNEGVTAIMLACAYSHMNVACLLSRWGASVDQKDNLGRDALSWCKTEEDRMILQDCNFEINGGFILK